MPELPEVETIRRGLENIVVGKVIDSVEHDNEKSFPNDPTLVSEFVEGSRITSIERRAKVLLIGLSTEYVLMVHLKMTGQMVFVGSQRFGAGHPNDSLIGQLPDKSTRVSLHFTDGSTLYFNDQRKFGWMKLVALPLLYDDAFLRRVGPEPLSEDFSDKLFMERLSMRPRSAIKAALLDQKVLAGVGNIYADESLWGAKIHPATRVHRLSPAKLKKLHHELIEVLNLSIQKGGSTDRNYVNVEGKKGSYIEFAHVFRRENQPCDRCGSIIVKMRVAGRGTHVCLRCQRFIA